MVIVDTSVVVKWIAEEEGSLEAKSLLQGTDMGAPDLLLYEFVNVLNCRPGFSEADVEISLNSLFNFKLQFFVLPQHQFLKINQLCQKYKITSYDASFVILAETLGVDLITADKKMAQKVNHLKFVHLL